MATTTTPTSNTPYAPSEVEIKAMVDKGLTREAAVGTLLTNYEQKQKVAATAPAPIAAPAPSQVTAPAQPVTTAAPTQPEPYLKPLPLTQQEYSQTIEKYVAGGYTQAEAQKRVDELFSARPRDFQTPSAAATTGQAYKIGTGDNLTKIAQKYGITVQDLLSANPQITDPNKIFAGQSLNIPAPGAGQGFQLPSGYERINGQQYSTTELQRANYSDIRTSPDGSYLYGRRTNPAESINAIASSTFDLIESGKAAADSSKRESTKEEEVLSKIEDILGIDTDPTLNESPKTVITSDGVTIDLTKDESALGMYRELIRSPEIQALERKAGDIQQELDKLDASEVAFANDIRKEVEGEAPQSYIDALVAERSKDLYPKKLALQAELRNITGRLTGEKENAANVLQFSLKDQDTRYNRMFQYLQYTTQKNQNAFSNQMELFNAIKDLPPERSVTINGKTYKGINEDANLSVIQFTDDKGNVTLVGLDKKDGAVKYTQVIGKTKIGSSGGVSVLTPEKELSGMIAEGNIKIVQGLQDGTYDQYTDDKGVVVFDKKAYEDALTAWNTGGSWYRNDESVTYNGKTYTGTASDMPNPLDYRVSSPSAALK